MRRFLIVAWCVLLVAGSAVAPASATFAGRNGRIVFSRSGESAGIHVIRRDGTGLRRLTARSDFGAATSPDGRRIAFVRDRFPRPERLLVMNADGSNKRVLATGHRSGCFFQSPHWSYDGRFIIFVDDCFDREPRVAQIRIAAADGSGGRALTDATSLNHLSRQPWSPDLEGNLRVVFTSDRDGDGDVYTMNADGSDVQQLTHDDDVDQLEAVWSPAGRWIAFSAQQYPTPEKARSDVIRVNEDGSGAVVVASGRTHATDPLWSPHGRRILFTSVTWMGASTAVVSNAAGTQHTPLEVGLSSVNAAWSPSSNRIVFATPRGLRVYNPHPAGVTSRRLRGTADAVAPDWAARR